MAFKNNKTPYVISGKTGIYKLTKKLKAWFSPKEYLKP